VVILYNKKSEWNRYSLNIERIDGEYQISLSDIIKKSINIFNDKNYNRILDLGCGIGRNSIFFAQHGFKVFASGISEKSINILKNKVYSKNISNIGIYKFNDILFEDIFFDLEENENVFYPMHINAMKKYIDEKQK
jgi:2-polyprenyl-3-methyl-5-hydroxy-6-metoxy-1,4-benzoquinol methylase